MNTVIITGVGPTGPLYGPLSKHFSVAVYDQAAAQRLTSTAGEPVVCPLLGAAQPLYDRARNDAALLTARITENLGQFGFSLNGHAPQALADWSGWMPGLAVAHLADVAAALRTLDAYAGSDGVDVAGVVTHEDVTPKYRTLALWARARGVAVIHLPHGNCFIKTEPDVHETSVADWILAASPYMRDWYAARDFPKGRIKVVGFPPWDAWASVESDRAYARRVLQLDQDATVVALCTGWPQRTNFVDDHETLEVAVRLTLQAARERGWRLAWKLHPGDVAAREQRCAQLAAACRVPALVTRDHLSLVMQAADAVLSVGPSNVLVEAGLVDRPPLLFDLRGYGFEGQPPWSAPLDQDKMADAVEAAAHGNGWALARDAFVKRYAYRNDGKATARAVRQIRRILGERVR